MTETWLCATDLSPASDAAVQEAARLAHATKSELVLLHVHPIEHVPEDDQTGERTYLLEMNLRRSLDRVAATLRDAHPGLAVKVDVAGGAPVRIILDEATRLAADRIVVGSHGRTGLAHVLLGSVAERVVREASAPVFVIKGRAHVG